MDIKSYSKEVTRIKYFLRIVQTNRRVVEFCLKKCKEISLDNGSPKKLKQAFKRHNYYRTIAKKLINENAAMLDEGLYVEGIIIDNVI